MAYIRRPEPKGRKSLTTKQFMKTLSQEALNELTKKNPNMAKDAINELNRRSKKRAKNKVMA